MAVLAHEQISRSIDDAVKRLGHERLNVESWAQMWPDATCGFPTAGGQAITTAQTVIVESREDPYGALLVYHRGQYAYTIKQPNQTFWNLVSLRRLPGAAALAEIDELERRRPEERTT